MAKHVYDIHFGCLGNGLVAYDVNSTKNNDYETVAHIATCGAYRLYKKLPDEVVARIVENAQTQAKHFRNTWYNQYRQRRWDILMDTMKWEDCNAVRAAGIDLLKLDPDEQLAYYYRFFCKNCGYTPLPDMVIAPAVSLT